MPSSVRNFSVAVAVACATCAIGVVIFSLWPRSQPSIDQLVTEAERGGDVLQQKHAVQALADYGEPALPSLRKLLRSDHPPEVRAAAAAAVGHLRDPDSAFDLFKAMEDDDVFVRARAAVAAQKIVGAHYFFDAHAPPDERRQIISRMRSDWESYLQSQSEQHN